MSEHHEPSKTESGAIAVLSGHTCGNCRNGVTSTVYTIVWCFIGNVYTGHNHHCPRWQTQD